MTNLIKTSLDLFIAIAILIGFGQQVYRMLSVQNSSGSKDTTNGVSIDPNGNITQPLSIPQMEGVLIKVTDNIRKPLQDVLANEKYNVKLESYKFEGPEWWFETALNYGHMIIVYILMSKYKTETNQSTKKKIMWGGALLVLGWFFLAPRLKQQKLDIQVKGLNVYSSNKIVPNQIVNAIASNSQVVLQEEQEQF